MPKKIGIIGGMSPESTITYYEYITHQYTQRFGNHAYPPVLIYSVSFQDYIDWPNAGRWDLVAKGLSEAAQHLEEGEVDVILIATNTMHIVFDEVQASVSVPMISLLDVVGEAIQQKGINKVGLLGTRFTMEGDLYPAALAKKGIEVVVPDGDERQFVNQVIYNELVAGDILPESKAGYLQVIEGLEKNGAEGIILGCTEIPLLVKERDTELPLFDTTTIHAEAALQFAIG